MASKNKGEYSSKEKQQEALQSGLSEFWCKVYSQYLDELQHTWQAALLTTDANSDSQRLIICLELLIAKLSEEGLLLSSLRNRYRIFATEIRQESDPDSQSKLILEFCRFIGNSNLRNDKRALSRWLDEAAVTERWQSKVKDHEFYVVFLAGRIAAFFDLVAYRLSEEDLDSLWKRLDLEKDLAPWLRYSFEASVQLAAFKSISSVLKSMHREGTQLLSPELQRYTYRFALDNSQQAAIQVESLQLLAVADINKAEHLIRTRLSRDEDNEQIFFKEAVSEIICLYCLIKPSLFDLVDDLIQDNSPLVRQSVIQTLGFCEDESRLLAIASTLANDKSDAVFCQLVTQLPYFIHDQSCLDFILARMSALTPSIRMKALAKGLVRWFEMLTNKQVGDTSSLVKCEQVLTNISLEAQDPKVQFIAMDTREKIWANSQRSLGKLLSPLFNTVKEGAIPLTKEQADAASSEAGKRWLSANIGHRFSIQLGQNQVVNNRLHSGERFQFRWWRFFLELLRPATDKRQHHSHVTGRLYLGDDFVPSASLAEVSATTIPGEPLHKDTDGHWRPFLPLVDQCLSSLQWRRGGKTVTLYHVSGKTKITPPTSQWARIKARLKLTFRFKYYADLRNVDYHSDHSQHYVNSLRKLGFILEHNGYEMTGNQQPFPISPSVARFFDLALPLSVLQFFQDFQRYFVSVYQNTIQHILVFTVALVSVFWGNHVLLSRHVKKARKQIPITIGGWGTRGKSGTERLKAALVNSQGLATVSKTTGCEAMFLYSTRLGTLKEMFLFRPYDKATIWEQTFVTRLAAKLSSDVLCWECMGLTPKYIDILQQQWMKDDFVTLTNCFPDHEDLQGPAGIDVPQVIAKFIAPNSRVWTTEENMLAYLEKEAHQKQADLTTVDWLEVATIPEDLLARFPYQEHPANIALIAKLASEMQIPRSWAIKEMADRVVPDIGVLQTFPYSQLNNANMRFINGMSANERYGALANWQRLGYDQSDRFFKGDFQLVTVINNRADRVPRSKVFARLIAFEFSAMTHFVIGNNLSGFKMFAEEAWEERLDAEFSDTSSADEFIKSTNVLTRFLLIFESPKAMVEALFKALPNWQKTFQDAPFDAIIQELKTSLNESGNPRVCQYFLEQSEKMNAYQALFEQAKCGKNLEAVIDKTRALLTQHFLGKLHLVDDYYISGEHLNQLIANHLPEHIPTDILGLQNIKGPGLDFVYSWQQYLRVTQLLKGIETVYGEQRTSLLNELLGMPEFGSLEKGQLLHSLQQLQSEEGTFEEGMGLLIDQLHNKLSQSDNSAEQIVSQKHLLKPILHVVEEVLDIFDAVIRGRKAKRILIDLAAQRISLNQAAHLLMQINKRQKGGWLSK